MPILIGMRYGDLCDDHRADNLYFLLTVSRYGSPHGRSQPVRCLKRHRPHTYVVNPGIFFIFGGHTRAIRRAACRTNDEYFMLTV